MINYLTLYHAHGIRRINQLISPPFGNIVDFSFPRDSVFHYLPQGASDVGPASNEILLRLTKNQINVEHIRKLESFTSKARPHPGTVETDIRQWHTRNRRFRLVRAIETAFKDSNTLVICNYGFLNKGYVFPKIIGGPHYHWYDSQFTLFKNMNKIGDLSFRQQYIVARIPKIIPSQGVLRQAHSANNVQKLLKLFPTDEARFVFELWKWFGPERNDSLFKEIDSKHLNKINLIFVESGKWFVLNLGVVDSWRKATEEEIKLNKETNTEGMNADIIQRRFLALLMAAMEIRTVTGDLIETDPIDSNPITDNNEETLEDPTITSSLPPIGKNGEIILNSEDVLREPDDKGSDYKHDALLEKKIEEDLQVLEKINEVHHAEEPEIPEVAEPLPDPITHVTGVKVICDKLAQQGLLSANEYKRFTALSEKFKGITAPNGKESLESFINVPSTLTEIPKEQTIPDHPAIVDKTMIQSSLQKFDSHYIENVLERDIASMVVGIQKAGIAVTEYETEDVVGLSNNYRMYSVRVVPVEGSPSTLRFRIPIVNKDGSFLAGGVKYTLRKQRGDLPIRKIAPDRVALTSYYGKTFVFRSEKKVNNYGWWLQNKITEIGLDTNDIRVVDLYPANVFDNEFKSPRLYSTLAMMFNGFTVNYQSKELPDVTETFVLSFDHTKRNELFGEDTVKLYETDGSIVVGYDKVKSYLIVDKNDQLYIGKNGNLTYLGSIEEFIGIDKVTPIDFAELKVMSKSVPVGIVLAYEVGLTKLINHFNIKTRIHHVGTGRVSMDPSSEFSIHFSDAILIFSKEDPLTRMIFAGFNEYRKTIKEFSIYEFDRKSVYFNVLESNGISVRYLREIDLMNQMFVDPITRDLLIEMKEPTDFRGLLIRSAQMLLNDQHPKEFDGAFMRIKGYERFAGAVYNELVETLRGHNARTGKANLALDFNPNAVWNNITQDRAVTLTSEINPIQYLKEVEAITYNGTGGRSAISMTKNSRVYHENDMGTISEATVDSSDVALNVYAPANPLFTSVRGISKRYDKEKINPTSLLSTSALISVAADRDDPKRVN